MIEFPITLVGAGGIGSRLALEIARIGCRNLTIYDPDIVEEHNLGNQIYLEWDIGRPKVEALKWYIHGVMNMFARRGSPMELRCVQERAGAQTRFRGIVIVTVDSLEARREIFSQIRYNARVPLYIEAGASEYLGIVYALTPHDKDHVAWYEPTLRDEAVAEGQRMCVVPEAALAFASVITRLLTGFCARPCLFSPIRSVIEFDEFPIIVTEKLPLLTP